MKSAHGPFVIKVSALRSDYAVVVNAQGTSLKTHLQGEYKPWPTAIAQLLADDLNALPQQADLRESLVYCLLSTFCEEENPQFALFVEDDLQWDAAYRLSDDDEIAALQYESITPLVKLLKDDWITLAENTCQNIQDMREQEVDFVPGEIVNRFLEFTRDYNQYQKYTVELLQSIFGGIHLSMILLWVSRKISSEDLMKSSLFLSCSKEDLESRKFSKAERQDIESFSVKLDALRQTLYLLRSQD
ncbi:MAG: hypothetical protein FJ333_07815 [Sphingomonadales bacterium]|nr:hypothetical protein [Sphingomonadales bacterium]